MAKVLDPSTITSIMSKAEREQSAKKQRYLDTDPADWQLMVDAVNIEAPRVKFPRWGMYNISYSTDKDGERVAFFKSATGKIVPMGYYRVRKLNERDG